MADKKITQLTQHTSVINSDLLPVVDITALETKKLAVGTLRDFVTQGLISSTETGSFYLSSSVNNDTITFNKGDETIDQVTVNNVSNAFTATTASFAFTASAFHVTVTDEPVTNSIVFVNTNSSTVETQEAKIDYALTYNPSTNQLTVPNLNVTTAFTSSLAEGYMWVGNSGGITEQISTGSFVTPAQTGSLVNSVYGLFNQTGSSTPISASVLETSLIGGGIGTLSVPANGFQVGDAYRAILTGHCTFHNADTLQIKIKAGSVVLADTGTLVLANATVKHWQMEVYFTIRKTGVAGVASIATGGKFTYSEDQAGKINGTNFSTENATTFDTTIPNTLVITGQFNHNDNTIYTDIFTLTKTF